MNEAVMRLKDKILSEILADLDDHEADRLKPKAAAVEITSMKPVDELHPSDPMAEHDEHEGAELPGGEPCPPGEEGEDDDDLKALMSHYMK